MPFHHTLLLLISIILSSPLLAKDIEYVILEKGTGRPIHRAELSLASDKWYSNRDGIVRVSKNLENKSFEIYRKGYKSLRIKNLDKDQKEFFLVPDQPDNDDIIVQGKRLNKVSQKKISISEAKEIAPRGDPAQVTKLLPGVQSTFLQPTISIRGSEPQDSGYYIDEIEVPFIYHSIGGISVIPERMIENVDFSAGGFGPRYGEITGGIVNLTTKNTVPEDSVYEFKTNIPIYSGFYHERPLSEKELFSVSFRKSYLEYIVPQFTEDSSTIIPSFQDAHIRYLKTHDSGYTKLITISSLDGLELAVPQAGDESGELSFDVSQYYGALGLEHTDKFNKLWKYKVSPNIVYSRIHTDVLDNFIRIRGWSYRLPIKFEHRIQGPRKARVGLDLRYENFDINIKAPDVVRDDPFADFEDAPQIETQRSYDEGYYAAWASYDLGFQDWVLTPGLRAGYASQLGKVFTDPRLQVSRKVSKTLLLKGAIGLYSKAPTPQETDDAFGNPDLEFEKSRHYILGFEKSLSDFWFLDNQIYYKSDFDVVRSDPVLRYNNEGERRSYGLEVFLRRSQTGRAFGWISYTYSKTEERRNREAAWGPTEIDQTHVINLVALYKFSGQWSLGTRVNYHTGNRYTPVSEASYNANLAKYQPSFTDSERYSKRLPDYHQIDLYSSYDFLWNRWKLKLRTGVEYLSFGPKAFDIRYNYDYTEEKFFSGIPIIPYIELSGVF